ncbi:MAG: hypothetical protein SGJ09_03020 [Phycisphaerae bacterium]|nr:hypothetical protein [Phycisphaerae bacterium]
MISATVALVLASALIEDPCDPAGRSCPTPFGAAGTLLLTDECALLDTGNGQQFLITEIGSFNNGDEVWVSGTLLAFCPAVCGPINGCIPGNFIGKPFRGCGTLQLGPQSCSVFVADSGEGFFLANEESFTLGDRVYVEGGIDLQSPFCQPFAAPGLQGNTIEACFEVCGTLSIGPQSCEVVIAEGQSYAVANYEGFEFGDEVFVSGKLNRESFACFPIPYPAIENNSIGTCPAVAADLNNDGMVDGADLALLLSNWNNRGPGDLNGDGFVNAADLAILLGAWTI